MPTWIDFSPESVALSSLRSALERLHGVAISSDCVLLAACDLHRAVQAALTAALAGSASIGASAPKIRSAWLEWFETSRDNWNAATPSWRVMPFRELLTEAVTRPLPWTQRSLGIAAKESFWLNRLGLFRDYFEHPKQLTFVCTVEEVAEAIAGSVRVCELALMEISHQLHDYSDELRSLVGGIEKQARLLSS